MVSVLLALVLTLSDRQALIFATTSTPLPNGACSSSEATERITEHPSSESVFPAERLLSCYSVPCVYQRHIGRGRPTLPIHDAGTVTVWYCCRDSAGPLPNIMILLPH